MLMDMRNKLFIFLAVLTVITLVNACNGSGQNNNTAPANTAEAKGFKTYENYCKACHGSDGKLGLSGAANLAASILSKQEVTQVVTNGRRLMAPFKGKLSDEQIDEVSDYVLTLRK